jgi:hypothetical protein
LLDARQFKIFTPLNIDHQKSLNPTAFIAGNGANKISSFPEPDFWFPEVLEVSVKPIRTSLTFVVAVEELLNTATT